MSGHSKWNNIKRKKEKTDAQKGKIFTKIGREMAVAVREGGPDPMNNGKLRDLIAKAKAKRQPATVIKTPMWIWSMKATVLAVLLSS